MLGFIPDMDDSNQSDREFQIMCITHVVCIKGLELCLVAHVTHLLPAGEAADAAFDSLVVSSW